MNESHRSEDQLTLEAPRYEPPKDLADLAERRVEGKPFSLILYVGEKALLDIVHLDEENQPDYLVARLIRDKDRAIDMFRHTPNFLPNAQAVEIFESRAA